MPPAPYQLVKKRCKAGYSRDVKGGSMCNPKPGYTPKATATRPRDKMGRFTSENTPLSQYASFKAGTGKAKPPAKTFDVQMAPDNFYVRPTGVTLPPGFKWKKKPPAQKKLTPAQIAQMIEPID